VEEGSVWESAADDPPWEESLSEELLFPQAARANTIVSINTKAKIFFMLKISFH
jgi:hypothetical protein